ncbi:hypothetical protein seszw300L.2_63 [Salmonella phage seszw]|nr:hypothetical protein seszw10L_63 [Salmonella phage seszw]QZB85858.1 hypothetical protein seszw10S_63 [Salmonella phage seszw]QZB85938.1 hypothetical protein seszw20L_63 [Salmonella phage seszw]QZB86017.1 hypothetical protein seszw20S_63 [Salmonella phage seszw]QZB86095.1 hypothetical protein seszw30L_63 [Salmonella phage seszw]
MSLNYINDESTSTFIINVDKSASPHLTNLHRAHSIIYIRIIGDITMRSYAGFTQEEKEQVYSLARAGVPDEVICRRYDIDEDFLLRVLDDVFVNLQEKRGYKGICCKNDFLRG